MAVSIITYIEVTTPEEVLRMGSLTRPKKVEPGDDLAFSRTMEVAASTTETLFDVANDIDDFDFLAIEADGTIWVEFTTDKNNGVGDEYYTVKLTADSPPLILAADDSYANYTANFAGGTADLIERVRVRNTGTATVRVRLIAAT